MEEGYVDIKSNQKATSLHLGPQSRSLSSHPDESEFRVSCHTRDVEIATEMQKTLVWANSGVHLEITES